jgi:inorganic phosphate transporter, PiT family
VVQADELTPVSILTGLMAAWLSALLTSILGIPSSTSHALVGGLAGAVLATAGLGALLLPRPRRVAVALLLSLPVGLLVGFLIVRLTLWLAQGARPALNTQLRRWQQLTMVALSVSHGARDAPEAAGVLTSGLRVPGLEHGTTIPSCVVAACIGSSLPWHVDWGLATDEDAWRSVLPVEARARLRGTVAGLVVVFSASVAEGSMSTTQVKTSATLGAGAPEWLNKVRWLILRDMLAAWDHDSGHNGSLRGTCLDDAAGGPRRVTSA